MASNIYLTILFLAAPTYSFPQINGNVKRQLFWQVDIFPFFLSMCFVFIIYNKSQHIMTLAGTARGYIAAAALYKDNLN